MCYKSKGRTPFAILYPDFEIASNKISVPGGGLHRGFSKGLEEMGRAWIGGSGLMDSYHED